MEPEIKIVINGRLNEELISYIVHLEAKDCIGSQEDELLIKLTNPENELTLPRFGDSLELSLGTNNNDLTYINQYFIDEITQENHSSIVLSGTSLHHGAAIATANRSNNWQGVQMIEAFKTIAGRNQLNLKMDSNFNEIELITPQENETDYQYLTRTAGLLDASVKITNKDLIILNNGTGKTASGKTMQPVNIDLKEVSNYTMLCCEIDRYSGVKAFFYLDDQYKTVLAGKDGTIFTLPETFNDEKTALIYANSKLKELQRKEQKLLFTNYGNSKIQVGTPIKLTNENPPKWGKFWIIEQVNHVINTSDDNETGYSQKIEAYLNKNLT